MTNRAGYNGGGGGMTSRNAGGMTNRGGGGGGGQTARKKRDSTQVGRRQGRRKSAIEIKIQEAETAAVAADVWSFGCLIAFADTGHAPYSDSVHKLAHQPGMTIAKLLSTAAKRRDDPLAPLRARDDPCPASVRKIAERCIHDDPHHRPAALHLYNEFKKGPALLREAVEESAAGSSVGHSSSIGSGPPMGGGGGPPMTSIFGAGPPKTSIFNQGPPKTSIFNQQSSSSGGGAMGSSISGAAMPPPRTEMPSPACSRKVADALSALDALSPRPPPPAQAQGETCESRMNAAHGVGGAPVARRGSVSQSFVL